jgi:hypothetical protein
MEPGAATVAARCRSHSFAHTSFRALQEQFAIPLHDISNPSVQVVKPLSRYVTRAHSTICTPAREIRGTSLIAVTAYRAEEVFLMLAAHAPQHGSTFRVIKWFKPTQSHPALYNSIVVATLSHMTVA